MNVKELVQLSFNEARAKNIFADTDQLLHRQRSRAWVDALSTRLHYMYGDDELVRVFWRGNDSNRADFKLNELLHDICVCKVETVASARHRKPLFYVCDVLWQVESELARDSRQALIDFNKLVLGSAKNKLFVGPLVRDTDPFIQVFRPAAKVCSGNVYLALVPHPDDWANSDEVRVWEFKNDGWEPCQ